jgi:hypothetical protein
MSLDQKRASSSLTKTSFVRGVAATNRLLSARTIRAPVDLRDGIWAETGQ